MNPHVSFHVNGGPVAIADDDFPRLIAESDIALQVCTAGNLRTALMCARLCIQEDAFDRYIIATDTPTGSGIMPLGMIYTMSHLASLADVDPAWCIAAATGNNAKIYGLESGFVANGKLADLLIIDAPLGCTKNSALGALANGDPVAIGAVITDGVPRFVGRSRNTPPTTRRVRVSENRVPQSYETPRY
jgi:enamidase